VLFVSITIIAIAAVIFSANTPEEHVFTKAENATNNPRIQGGSIPKSIVGEMSAQTPAPVFGTDAPPTAPRSDNAEDWLTYTTKTYRYSIQYPRGAFIDDTTDPR